MIPNHENTTKYKPHFKTVNTSTTPSILENDIEIFKNLYEYRFLTTPYILSLSKYNHLDNLNRRLAQLFHAGFLIRIKLGNNDSILYLIGPEAGPILATIYEDEDLAKINWKNRAKLNPFSQRTWHDIKLSLFLATIKAWCNAEPTKYRFVSPREIIKNRKTIPPKLTRPLSWEVEFKYAGKDYIRILEADSVCGVQILNPKTGKPQKTKYFFIEKDYSTETVESCSLTKSTIFKKYLLYNESHEQNLITKHFGFKNFRVLFPVSKNEIIEPNRELREKQIYSRISKMITLNQAMDSKFPNMYKYSPFETIVDPNNPAKINGSFWLSGKGERCNLVD